MRREILQTSVTNVLGWVSSAATRENYRGAETEVKLLKKIMIRIALNDEFVQPCIIDAIIMGARSETSETAKFRAGSQCAGAHPHR